MSERDRIARIARRLGGGGPDVITGIGDDAAVLAPAGERLVWTIDEQVEGVHFRRDWLGWGDLGWRSFMAAASDVAAMGAAPWCALAALVLPDDVDDAALDAIVEGQRAAADAAGAPVVGGNLSRGPALSLATTFLGRCAHAVTRAGARPGDGVWIAGGVGLASAGLRALERGKTDAPLAPAVEAWRRPVARFADGRAMAAVAHAAIDVSDGLARDCGSLADASAVQLVLDAAAIAADTALEAAAAALGADALDLALHGGEDYAIVAASDVAIAGFRRIGEVRPGRGLVLRTPHGERPLAAAGFDHWG